MAKPGVAPSRSRGELLDAALEIIDRDGVESFSMRSLARHVGLSPMGLYTYFSSRDDIFKAILDRLVTPSVIQPVPGERWDDTIRRIADVLYDVVNAHPEALELYQGLQHDWVHEQHRIVYRIHADQGMPDRIYIRVYYAFSALFSGYLNGLVREKKLMQDLKERGAEPDKWESAIVGAYDKVIFDHSLEYALKAIYACAEPDPADWRTPEDPSEWTWTGANISTLY